jgi:ABC-type molybdate transport system substrate-binding protein
MKLWKLFTFIAIAGLFSCNTQHEEITAPIKGWKIMFGDNPEWAKPDIDDSSWDTIGVAKQWDFYGYKDRSGYAWYRVKVFLPSEMKNRSEYGEDIVFELGKIDDADQTFLNGKLIGMNGTIVPEGKENEYKFRKGSFWNTPRNYRLPVNDSRIKWDKENVIAIKVWNGNDLGGIFGAENAVARMQTLSDYVKIDNNSFAYDIKNQKDFKKGFNIVNNSAGITFSGKLTTTVKDRLTGEDVFTKTHDIELKPGHEKDLIIEFSTKPGQNCTTEYKYVDGKSGKKVIASENVPYILTPPSPDKPVINGPVVYGASPEREFLYKMPVSGKKPMKYSVKGLPATLKVDPETGIITGKTPPKGKYKVTFRAKNKFGSDEKEFTIVSGNTLALTPPMGWNSWNCWGLSVSDEKIRISARQMVKSGLADYGFTYINIDDGWEANERTKEGLLLGNEKFPDFPTLSKYVHSLGLKLGIYSGPGPYTCGMHLASYQHEYLDAKTWGEWGIDYLKYDWCFYEDVVKDHSLPELKKPYILMRKALDKVNRDIVYSLCQYGWGDVWKWGRELGGELWRTTGDITDTWESLKDIGFRQYQMSEYAGPGGWNDPDMLIVGWVGWSSNLHPTRLTPDEQYTHISLWSLLSAPLLLGNDMARLDAFTLNLLTNAEVLAIDQDPLGKQANKVYDNEGIQYWLKEMSDGSYALGVFNLNDDLKKHNLDLKNAGLKGTYKTRDVWRQKDMEDISTAKEIIIPAHGVYLVRLTKK